MEKKTVEGGCLCGAVRFAVELPTSFCAHCHCGMCRRGHGAGFVTWFGVPQERFRVAAGAEKLVRYRSSAHATRSFCRCCGSSLFFESAQHPGQVHVVLANMDAAIDRLPELHVFFDDRAAWVHIADELPRLGGPTGFEPL
jgi:hypothetical protein